MFKLLFPDSYSIFARYLPAVIGFLPSGVLIYMVFQSLNLNDFFKNIQSITVLPITLILMYFVSLLGRMVGKYIESLVFKRGFPTTYLMLFGNKKEAKSLKIKYRQKIKKKHDIDLLNEEEEVKNEEEAIKILNYAGRTLAESFKKNETILRHNILYGFYRNLIGCSFIGILLCIVLFILYYIYNTNYLLNGNIIILITHTILCIFLRILIVKSGEDYAHKLITIFMSEE